MNEKHCTKCLRCFSFTQFSVRRASKDGRSPICKKCRKSYIEGYRSHNREVLNAERRAKYRANPTEILDEGRKWRNENKNKCREMKRNWRLRNPELNKRQRVTYRERNREKIRARSLAWNRSHPEVVNSATSKYRCSKLRATPPWLSNDHLNQIAHFYVLAQMKTRESGEQYSVDHIVPIQGKNVRGLHVPWNLRVILLRDNKSKGNRWER